MTMISTGRSVPAGLGGDYVNPTINGQACFVKFFTSRGWDLGGLSRFEELNREWTRIHANEEAGWILAKWGIAG